MVPGQFFCVNGDIKLNEGAASISLSVANSGDRPIQIGSHYHFAEANSALVFDRSMAHGFRLNIASGTAVRFEPGQTKEISLVPYTGNRRVFGFNQLVMGKIS